jgi:hypothetical protein
MLLLHIRMLSFIFRADRCADLYVLSTKLKSRNLQNSEQLYTVVGTATEQYKVV